MQCVLGGGMRQGISSAQVTKLLQTWRVCWGGGGNNSVVGMFNVLYVNLPEIKTSGL